MGWGEVVELWWKQREEEGGERDGGGGRGWESSSEWVRGPCPEVRTLSLGLLGAARREGWEVVWRVKGWVPADGSAVSHSSGKLEIWEGVGGEERSCQMQGVLRVSCQS